MVNEGLKEREKSNKLLLELLEEYIKICPYMRIGQILYNCIPNIDDLYYLESDAIIKRIITNIKQHPEVFEGKVDLSKYIK